MSRARTAQLAIEATGAVTPERVSRALSRHICRHCGLPILRGLDADLLAFDVAVDPEPVDTLGEAIAVATGRRTYDAVRSAARRELEIRRAAHIARPRRYDVLAEHRCGQRLPATAGTTSTPEMTDDPPF